MQKRNLIALALLAAIPSVAAAQDAFGYTASSDIPYSYLDIGNTGTSVLTNTDDGSATLTLPFSFRFYGVSYTSLCVSTNGLISFGGCVPDDYTNLDLTAQSPTGDRPLIAPFWMDLSFADAGAGSVVYQTLGSVGSRKFVIQWKNALALNAPGGLDFQAILCEGTNHIILQHRNVLSGSPQASSGASATVGIRDTGAVQNSRRLQWSFRSPVIANGRAIQFTAPGTGSTAVDVTSSVKVTMTAFTYNRTTKLYAGTITIQNTGSATLNRPLSMVLTGLTPGVTAVMPTGTVADGPFYSVAGTTPLAPGQSSTTAVQFSDPSGARIIFNVKVYSGNL